MRRLKIKIGVKKKFKNPIIFIYFVIYFSLIRAN